MQVSRFCACVQLCTGRSFVFRVSLAFCSEVCVFGAGLLDNLLLCARELVRQLCSTLLSRSRFPNDLSSVSRSSRSCPRLHPCIGVSGHSAPAPASAMSDRNAAAGVGDRVGDDSAGKGNLSHTGGLFGGPPTLLLIVFVPDIKQKLKKTTSVSFWQLVSECL